MNVEFFNTEIQQRWKNIKDTEITEINEELLKKFIFNNYDQGNSSFILLEDLIETIPVEKTKLIVEILMKNCQIWFKVKII
jgi:hypothetical protein